MPRYYFHLHNSLESPDPEGRELPDLAAAEAEAVEAVRDLIADDVRTSGELTLSHRIDIADAEGNTALTVRFGDAVRINP